MDEEEKVVGVFNISVFKIENVVFHHKPTGLIGISNRKYSLPGRDMYAIIPIGTRSFVLWDCESCEKIELRLKTQAIFDKGDIITNGIHQGEFLSCFLHETNFYLIVKEPDKGPIIWPDSENIKVVQSAHVIVFPEGTTPHYFPTK